jgi:hypothetical protein
LIDAGLIAINPKTENDTTNKTDPTIDKDIAMLRFIDSKKPKLRQKGRLLGGQNKQGRSPVYE